MARWMVGLALCSWVVILSGCGGASAPKRPTSVDVAGTVQLSGTPLDDGEISLGVNGEAPVIIPIKAGKFTGKAMVGDNAVRVFAYKIGKPIMMNDQPVGEPVKENYIDEKFNEKSTLTAKIAAGGSKELKFDVEAKK